LTELEASREEEEEEENTEGDVNEKEVD